MIATAKGFFDGQQNNETKSDIVDSLIGAIPDTGKTLDDYRSERLKKYEDNG